MEDRMLNDEILLGLIKANSGGGGGGTDDYEELNNLPQINSVELKGNKSLSDLGIASALTVSGILDGQTIDSFADVESALSGKQNTLTFDDTPTDGSNNPVKSNGIYDALSDKADKSAVKTEFIGTTAEWNALTAEQKKAYDTYQITDDYTEGSGGLPNYSTTEQLTGQKWIDGKDIYFKTVEISVPSDISTGIKSFPVSTPNISAIKKVEIISSINITGYVPWYNIASVMFSEATETTLDIYFGGNHYAGQKIYVTIYYTKTA